MIFCNRTLTYVSTEGELLIKQIKLEEEKKKQLEAKKNKKKGKKKNGNV